MNKTANVTDLGVRRLINTLIKAEGSEKIGIMSLGRVLVVYEGTDQLHRFTCSSAMEASKTADRIQEAYDQEHFKKMQMM